MMSRPVRVFKKRRGGPGRGHKKSECSENTVIVDVNEENNAEASNESRPKNVCVTDNTCASEKKLSAAKEGYTANLKSNNQQINNGNIIIDIGILSKILNSVAKCKHCDSHDTLLCSENVSGRVGLASSLDLSCSTCSAKQSFYTSKHCDVGYEVNARLVYGLRCIGKGQAAGKTLCAVMNLPQPPTRFITYNKFLTTAIRECAELSMSLAIREAIVCNEGSKDLTVAIDGTWQKRGHTSNNGVVSATSVAIGKVIDVEVLTKYCQTCVIYKHNKNKLKQHQEGGKCKANYTGVSGGMESVGAVTIFERSMKKYDVRYVNYLGDGDSKAFKRVVESKPYGDTEITKLECVGHVQKRMGTRLRKIKKDHSGKRLGDGKFISGQGRLSDKEIDNLQTYYGAAIRRNANKLEQMRQDVWATYFHKMSTDKSPQHALCPKGKDSWCKFNRAVATGELYTHKHSLPSCVGQIIKPIYRSLADNELLRKCLHGKTQNPNESFNSVIWCRLPKNVFVGYDTLVIGVLDAVLTFNEGNSGRVKVLQCLGIEPGFNALNIFQQIDNIRIRKAKIKQESRAKTTRMLQRNEKRSREDEDDLDGPEYSSGMY